MSSTTVYNVIPNSPLKFPGSREYVFACTAGGPALLTSFNDGEQSTVDLALNEPVAFSIDDKGEYIVSAIGHARVSVTENRESEKHRESAKAAKPAPKATKVKQ